MGLVKTINRVGSGGSVFYLQLAALGGNVDWSFLILEETFDVLEEEASHLC